MATMTPLMPGAAAPNNDLGQPQKALIRLRENSRRSPVRGLREFTIPAMKNTRSPLGLGLLVVGAALVVLGAFLPYQESPRFIRVEHNALIQNQAGWLLAALALVFSSAATRPRSAAPTKHRYPSSSQPFLRSRSSGSPKSKACELDTPSTLSPARSIAVRRVWFPGWVSRSTWPAPVL